MLEFALPGAGLGLMSVTVTGASYAGLGNNQHGLPYVGAGPGDHNNVVVTVYIGSPALTSLPSVTPLQAATASSGVFTVTGDVPVSTSGSQSLYVANGDTHVVFGALPYSLVIFEVTAIAQTIPPMRGHLGRSQSSFD